MDFYGLDMLGAITVSPKKEKAAAAGRRALAAAQKVAKRLPRLSKAISSAGQKALKVAGSSSAAAPSPVKKADAAKPAPSPSQQQRAPQPQQKPMQGRPQGPALRPQSQPVKASAKAPPLPSRGGPAKRGTKLGEEQADESTDQQADIYTQLADAAVGVVDFLAYFQGLLDRIPQNLPLYQKGIGTISQFENWFAAPIEAALQGDQAALAKAPDIYGLIEYFKEQGEATGEKRWPWDWASLAETYLKLHPGAEAPAEPGVGPVADESGTAPSGAVVSNVAKVVVSPTGMTVPIGGTQLFRVDTLDAKNKVVTSQSPITWFASGGATIDPSGNFSAQSAGTYTITASIDGVTGTATAIVQTAAAASPAASPSAPYSGGGGDYGGGGYSGSDYADSGSQDAGGGEYASYDGGYAEPAEPEYSEQEMYSEADQGQVFEEEYYPEEDGELDDPFYGATVEELGAIVELGKGGGGKGGGGKGGGKWGGHRHHHGGGGRRFEGGGPWYYGPWWPSYGIEISEPFDEPTVDDLAEVIAEKLAQKKTAAVGLDCLGTDDLLGASSPFIVTAGDLTNAAAQLKASADNVNLTAAKVPGWAAIYETALRLHEKYKSLTFWDNINPFGDRAVTQGAWDAIADAQKRVEEFAAFLRSKGAPVVEPEHQAIESTLDKFASKAPGTIEALSKNLPWIIGGAAVLGVGAIALPYVIPMIAASRLRKGP